MFCFMGKIQQLKILNDAGLLAGGIYARILEEIIMSKHDVHTLVAHKVQASFHKKIMHYLHIIQTAE